MTEVLLTSLTNRGVVLSTDYIPIMAANGQLLLYTTPAALATYIGTGAFQTATVLASETIAASSFVNVYNNAGVTNVRLADGTDPLKFCNGFCINAITSGQSGLVSFGGFNSVTVATPASYAYLSVTVPGSYQTTAPTVAGQIVQTLGPALVGVGIPFQPGVPITLT